MMIIAASPYIDGEDVVILRWSMTIMIMSVMYVCEALVRSSWLQTATSLPGNHYTFNQDDDHDDYANEGDGKIERVIFQFVGHQVLSQIWRLTNSIWREWEQMCFYHFHQKSF